MIYLPVQQHLTIHCKQGLSVSINIYNMQLR